jgi:hypothetical protein
MVIGTISTTKYNIDPIFLVLAKFRKWAYIMMKEVVAKFPKH